MSLLSYYCTLVYTMLGWLIFALLPATIWLFQEPGQLELAPARSLSAVLLCGTLTNNLHCSELSVNGSPPFCLILIRLKLALNNVIAIKNIVHNDLYKNLKKKQMDIICTKAVEAAIIDKKDGLLLRRQLRKVGTMKRKCPVTMQIKSESPNVIP